MKIYRSPIFKKRYVKIPQSVQDLALQKEILFRKNSHDPTLKTHKLKGKLHGQWSFSINRAYRIVFYYISDDEVLFISIGTHEIYR